MQTPQDVEPIKRFCIRAAGSPKPARVQTAHRIPAGVADGAIQKAPKQCGDAAAGTAAKEGHSGLVAHRGRGGGTVAKEDAHRQVGDGAS